MKQPLLCLLCLTLPLAPIRAVDAITSRIDNLLNVEDLDAVTGKSLERTTRE